MTLLWKFDKYWSLADVRTALSRGADINCKGGIYVEPVLMRAVWAKRDDVVAFLLEQPGILVNATNNNGEAALHYALYHANERILRMLLKAPGVNADVSTEGETLLMTAVSMACGHMPWHMPIDRKAGSTQGQQGFLRCVKAIALAAGVNLDTKNEQGHALEDVARGRADVLRTLQQARRKREEEKGEKGGRKKEMEVILRKHEMELRLSKEVEDEVVKEAQEKRENMEKEYTNKLAALAKEKQEKVDKLEQELKEKQEFIAKKRQRRFEALTKEMMTCSIGEKEVAFRPQAPDCPVCFDPMAPPVRIFSCAGGHLLCGNCRPRITVSMSTRTIYLERRKFIFG